MATDELIGKNLMTLRGEMSQKDLAGAMRAKGWKWSQATVWSIEKGDRPLRLSEAFEIARMLGVPLELLLSEGDYATARVAAGRCSQSAKFLESAIADYDADRLQLALALDELEDRAWGDRYGESWIDESAHDVVDRVHAEAEEENSRALLATGTSEAEVEAGQLEGRWARRLLEVDRVQYQTEA